MLGSLHVTRILVLALGLFAHLIAQRSIKTVVYERRRIVEITSAAIHHAAVVEEV